MILLQTNASRQNRFREATPITNLQGVARDPSASPTACVVAPIAHAKHGSRKAHAPVPRPAARCLPWSWCDAHIKGMIHSWGFGRNCGKTHFKALCFAKLGAAFLLENYFWGAAEAATKC